MQYLAELKFSTFFTILFIINTYGQYQNIRIDGPQSYNPEEVTIAINPLNTEILAGGANIDHFYFSNNGGLNWNESHLESNLGVWGDPCVLFDSLGNIYYAHLSNPVTGWWIDRIVVQKSTDYGQTWNNGFGIGQNIQPQVQDKEWMAVDHTQSEYRGNIYISWTEFDDYGSSNPNDSSRIRFSKSTDQGETFSDAITISDQSGDCFDDDNTTEGAVPAVGPNGEVYISWAGPLGLMFDKSLDGGETWGTDIFVSDIPGGWAFDVPGIYRVNGMPITLCDISSSPYRGNIYICWGDQRNGTSDTDVFFSRSTDGGVTWSTAMRVNDDNTTRHQFFPWMAIDPTTGHLWGVFYDRRNTIGVDTDVYMVKSTDGGQTFENFKVSESSFTPTGNVFFGDYTNITAWDGKIFPIWMRLHDGQLSVWTALVEDSTVPVELTDFSGSSEDGKVTLLWKTATEQNNLGFEIERAKLTGKGTILDSDFKTVGFVEGKGTTTIPQNYIFIDEELDAGVYKYRIKQVDYNGDFRFSNSIEIKILSLVDYILYQNYPNPFNPSTTISFQIPSVEFVTVKIFDSIGNEVKTLVKEYKNAGVHEVNFDASELGSGVYIYRISAGTFNQSKKMLVLK